MERIEMQFENAIRRAHNCGRYEAPGANADLFAGFISWDRKQKKISNEKDASVLKTGIEYGIRLGQVSMSLDIAIKKVISLQKESNPVIVEKIEDLRERLSFSTTLDEISDLVIEFNELIKQID